MAISVFLNPNRARILTLAAVSFLACLQAKPSFGDEYPFNGNDELYDIEYEDLTDGIPSELSAVFFKTLRGTFDQGDYFAAAESAAKDAAGRLLSVNANNRESMKLASIRLSAWASGLYQASNARATFNTRKTSRLVDLYNLNKDYPKPFGLGFEKVAPDERRGFALAYAKGVYRDDEAHHSFYVRALAAAMAIRRQVDQLCAMAESKPEKDRLFLALQDPVKPGEAPRTIDIAVGNSTVKFLFNEKGELVASKESLVAAGLMDAIPPRDSVARPEAVILSGSPALESAGAGLDPIPPPKE
jgi:hypothetical protein